MNSRTIIIWANNAIDLVNLIHRYTQRQYVLLNVWRKRRWWMPWTYLYYAKMRLEGKINITIGPVSTRPLPPKPPTLVINIGPVTTRSLS